MKPIVLLFLISISSHSVVGQTENIISVYFNVDADTPIRDEENKLSLLNTSIGSVIITRIVSYTDKSGSTTHNRALAERRANSIQSLLSSIGEPEQIIIKGEDYTAENYVASEYRRVDIFYRKPTAIIEEERIPEVHLDPIELSTDKPTELQLDSRESHLIEEFTEFLLDSSASEAMIVLSIEFYGGSATFLDRDDPDLWRLFDILHYNENITALIRGHVCCGDDIGLSYRRAFAVEEFLTSRSISIKRLSSKGYSNTIPAVSPELTEADRRKNRRVDVIFHKK
ncbi:MAG: outer membrane protein OmpA-like peptidoglycan-associated protein [Crocinitomicaceae bacterium]|jgi:outer membrane protein OmpA-like peptidoglycan-associated protein